MKIAYVSSSEFGCPPPENQIQAALSVASQVIEGITKKGHETIYVGVDKSTVGASKIISMGPAFFDIYDFDQWAQLSVVDKDQTLASYQSKLELFLIEVLKKEKVDLVHFHTSPPIFMLPFGKYISVPKIQTFHDPVDPPYENIFFQNQNDSNYFVSISDSQRRGAEYIKFSDTVYNGVDIKDFPFSGSVDKTELLFLGRFRSQKGVDQAIQAAKRSGVPLNLAGRTARTQIDFYNKEVAPYVDGTMIKNLGMIDRDQVSSQIGQSKALLFPIRWEEPFGLVMIESMACGSPVIAYNRGSVPEVIKDGVTGFIIDPPEGDPNPYPLGQQNIKKRGIDGLVEAISRLGEIDRNACRKHVEENFTVEKMVDGYEEVYKKVIEESRAKGI